MMLASLPAFTVILSVPVLIGLFSGEQAALLLHRDVFGIGLEVNSRVTVLLDMLLDMLDKISNPSLQANSPHRSYLITVTPTAL